MFEEDLGLFDDGTLHEELRSDARSAMIRACSAAQGLFDSHLQSWRLGMQLGSQMTLSLFASSTLFLFAICISRAKLC